MDYLFCQDTSIFAFPVNLIVALFLVLGIRVLHSYNEKNDLIQKLTGMPVTLLIIALIIIILIIEGIWSLQLFKTWIFILLELILLMILGLITQRKKRLSGRNILFLLNHGGLWIALTAALLGAPDREEYKLIATLGQPEYNAIDKNGALHPLPFIVKLDKFEVEYHSQQGSITIPKHFCSTLTLKTEDKEIQTTLEVNHPVRIKGYMLYQDNYDQTQGADSQYSVLLVVRDPWLWLVYTGIFMLLIGAVGLIIYGPIKRKDLGT